MIANHQSNCSRSHAQRGQDMANMVNKHIPSAEVMHFKNWQTFAFYFFITNQRYFILSFQEDKWIFEFEMVFKDVSVMRVKEWSNTRVVENEFTSVTK